MSDIHGCLAEFEEALVLSEEHLDSGRVNVLLVDTDTDTYYNVTEAGSWKALPYEE